MIDRDFIRFRPLPSGAASGAYTLPQRVLDKFEVVERLEAYQVAARSERSGPAARADLAAAIVAAARDGKPLPSGGAFVKAEAEDRAADIRSSVLSEVLEEEVMRLVGLVSSSAEEIVTDHLAPALAEVVEEAKIPADLVQPFGTDPEQYLRAPDDVRTALIILRDLADRYEPIWVARAVFRPELKVEYDTSGIFGSIRNREKIDPHFQHLNASPPWPVEKVGRLVWCLSNGAELWMPTPAQQDARWLEVFGDRLNKKVSSAAAAKMFGARAPELAPVPPAAA